MGHPSLDKLIISVTVTMKALKCKTLGASVMYIVIYTYVHGNMHTQTNA